jgi:DNA-nicking Smr family endonuclease
MEPVHLPIEDQLDLHHFRPREIPNLLDDYFEACIRAGIFNVRVIHGKGQGILKKQVLRLLNGHPLVTGYHEAPPDAGGWGATLVELVKRLPNAKQS